MAKTFRSILPRNWTEADPVPPALEQEFSDYSRGNFYGFHNPPNISFREWLEREEQYAVSARAEAKKAIRERGDHQTTPPEEDRPFWI